MNSSDTAQRDIAYIRLALLNETLRRVEKLPYPGEIQSCVKRRSSLLRLSELLYSVCGCEELPSFTPENKPEQKKPETGSRPQPEKQEPSAEAKELTDFMKQLSGNVLRSAAEQAARSGRVNSDTAKRAAVTGIAQTISLMMREDKDR